MIGRTLTIVGSLLVPAVLSAQSPPPGNPPVAAPNDHASATAKARVAAAMERRATRVRGEAVGLDNRPVTPAVPATRATRATPAVPNPDGGPATRAVPATPAVPASPSQRPDSPSQGRGRRP